MSFIYGILSSVLVGLCAAFVAKCRTNADEAKQKVGEAKENAAKAEEHTRAAKDATGQAKKAAKDAEASATRAKDKASSVECVIKQAKEAAKDAKASATEAKENAQEMKEAKLQTEKATEIANRLSYRFREIGVLNRVIFARAALSEDERIDAMREICRINDEIYSLLEDKEFIKILKNDHYYNDEIQQVYDELIYLKQNIDNFRKSCRIKYSGGDLESREKTADNCCRWIDESLKRIKDKTIDMKLTGQ